MSSITGSLFGGGGSGMAFRGQGTNILQPTTVAQANTSYDQTQAGLKQQQDFLTALQAQNGLANQSSVFNQLQGVANGTGPNPAMAQLNQATAANTANQAALMAGQRGSNANAGLIARQAAMQGGRNQQNAAGQAATLQAGQSLNAMNNMGQLATNQANQQSNATNAYTNSALSQQQNVLGGINAQNNANVGMQSNINNVNAGLAGTVAGQQGNMLGGIMGGIGSIGSMFGGSGTEAAGAANVADMEPIMGEAVMAKGGMVSRYADGGNISPIGSTPLQQDPSGPKSNAGQFFNQTNQDAAKEMQAETAPAMKAAPAKGKGGGNPLSGMEGMMKPAMQGLTSWGEHEALPYIGDFFGGLFGSAAGTTGAMAGGAGDAIMGVGAGAAAPETIAAGAEVAPVVMAAAKGGKVPALVSPGERYLPPKDVKKVMKGKDPLKTGRKIPGKPKYPGNDYRNDTVPEDLDEGGLIIPNKILQSKNSHWEAMKFVHATMAKNRK